MKIANSTANKEYVLKVITDNKLEIFTDHSLVELLEKDADKTKKQNFINELKRLRDLAKM